MTNDFEIKVAGTNAASGQLAQRLKLGETISRSVLLSTMRAAMGADAARGRWTLRDAFDALELAQLLTLIDGGEGGTPRDRLDQLEQLVSRTATQTARSEAQIAMQQFSTPLPIGYLACRMLGLTEHEAVLEPSAGIGLLAVHAQVTGARLVLNERDPWRLGLLRAALPEARCTDVDGEIIADRVRELEDITAVLMNPPFSRSEGRGRDGLAGLRHLRGALRVLRGQGRCVAVLPNWYDSSSAEWRDATRGYRSTLSIRLPDNAYGKHGTSIGVKLVRFEPGNVEHAKLIDVATLGAALDAIDASPYKRPLVGVAQRTLGAFRRPRQSTVTGPVQSAAATTPAPPTGFSEIVYDVHGQPAPAGEAAGLYLAYRPSRIDMPQARSHPTALVESNAMGSIAAPRPRYRPMLPEHVVREGRLSLPQLETLIYAGEAFEHDLVAAATDEDGDEPAPTGACRMGFFLGDGTGAGKGRQVASIVLDQWLRGRRKALWISMTEALLEDARRDWVDLGGLPLDIQHLNQWKVGTPITAAEGILFLTYATLRSDRGEGGSRLRQLLDWLGRDFDGVIVFDEAHAMANAGGGEALFGKAKGSEQGIAGLRLQAALPRARVLYVSATGASDVNKLAYASRLGLWGAGTPFATRSDFVERVRRGGTAAMEVVARDLKALGLYFARALSYAGIEYEPLEHALTPAQIEIYDAYADAFAIIHAGLGDALDAARVTDDLAGETLNKGAKAAAFSAFESTKQRFFGALLLSMKLPSLIPAIEADLAQGAAVVVQLVTTGEAMLDRQLAGLSAEDRAEPDIELSPREYVVGYLERAFPTRMMEVYLDDEGERRSRPMSDEEGNPVFSQEALAAREGLIERLCAMPAVGSALDHLIERFGPDKVAEVTGRSRRLVTDARGKQRIEARSGRANVAETAAFMRGEKPIIAFSNAGGTGRSYHASLKVANQARRHHYLLEPGWRADVAIQGLGRTHRTEQASAPLFRPVSTDCRGERRFISTIARRLDAMGAITRGQRQTGGQGMFDPRDNLESDYAKDALLGWYRLLHGGKLASIGFDEFCRLSGLALAGPGGELKEELPPIQRWLNRILALRIATQNAIFDEFLGLIEARVEAARAAGTLDVGIETIAADRITVLKRTVIRTDARSGAETVLLELETEQRLRPLDLGRALAALDGGMARAAINGKSGKAALLTKAASMTGDDGRPVRRWRLARPLRHEIMTDEALGESAWTEAERSAFVAAWEHELGELAGKTKVDRLHLVTGLLLPVWGALDDDQVQVWRLTTDDGQSILGRIIPPAFVERVAKALGSEITIDLTGTEIAANVIERGEAMPIGDYRLRRARVGGEYRLELVDWGPARLAQLKSMGLFTEILGHKTRLFVPLDRAGVILEQLRATATAEGMIAQAA